MKVKKLNKKTVLNKVTIANLDSSDLNRLHGGAIKKTIIKWTDWISDCGTCYCEGPSLECGE